MTALLAGVLTVTGTRLQAQFPVSDRAQTSIGSLAYLFFGGRRIWTFRIADNHWDVGQSRLDVEWPPALVPHLVGSTSVRLEIHSAATAAAVLVAEVPAQFGPATTKLALVDPLSGTDLVINKWGRLAKSFEAAGEELQHSVLHSAHALVRLLEKELGLKLFMTGGTLLGLVRDGKLISSDDDADLAYLSSHENPSDIVLESYKVEEVLARHGLETVRHSSGHLQVMFAGTPYTDGYYVDIFTYFVTGGWFYGTFHAREKAADVTVLPIGTLDHNGLQLPIPANTDQMLAAIYGKSWRTPDPAFTFVTPESAGRRFYWWLNHYDAFREDWEDFHRGLISAHTQPGPSSLAQWLMTELEPESTVVELGCGLGSDALALAEAGHNVLGCDYSRPAISYASRLASALNNGTAATHETVTAARSASHFKVANMNSVRHVATMVKSAAELAGPQAPITVVSRNLFDNLHYLGRDNALLAISHLLVRGGRAYLQIRNPKQPQKGRDLHEPVGEEIFDPEEFNDRLDHYGLEIIQSNFLVPPDLPDTAGSTLSYILGKVSHP